MALRFIDSFDHYATAYVTKKWTALNDSFAVGITTGRFGSGWLHTSNRILRKEALGSHATWIAGVAFFVTSYVGQPLAVFIDGTTEQCGVFLNSSGKLEVRRCGDNTVLGTGTTTVPLNVWHYLEFKATIHNSTGVAVVKLNGIEEINITSQDTQNTANALATGFQIGSTHGAGNSAWVSDDVYVCDGSGSAPTNDFLGDVRVEALFPNGNGNSSQFDGSDGNSTDNYALVDEASPNDDTDYVESSTVTDKDTYAYTNLTSTAGTVYGVQICPYVRKADAGARTFKTVARLSATETDGPDTALSTTYQYLNDVREAKPGGGAWGISDVNSAEFGLKVFS